MLKLIHPIPRGEREPNRSFLHLNKIKDGIMRKDTKAARITEIEIERNKQISKKLYIRFQPVGLPGRRVEQYFGLSHQHNGFRLVELEPTARREQIGRDLQG